ncbi:MAG: GspH/FimT family pseudopilin [Burkholderiales bacterium]
MTMRRGRGFTLIELMVALGIAAFLLVLAAPGFSRWIADSEIHNAAQSVAGALRMAQAEAIKQNRPVQFVMNTGTGAWAVQLASTGTDIHVGAFAEGSARVVFTTSPASLSTVTYDGLGQIAANADASATIDRITLTSPTVAGTRTLTVLVRKTAGAVTTQSVKICDPYYTFPDPKACP